MTENSPDPQQSWNEDDSSLFRRLADIAVPSRAEQIATLLTLMPFAQDDLFHVVELGCGTGGLAWAILDFFPNARLTALDGSPSMLSHATVANRTYADRARFAAFDLADQGWLPRLTGADCVVSSLTLHHLVDEEKHRLFAQIGRRLSPRGAFLLADLVMPQRPEARRLFADTWDRNAAEQSTTPETILAFEESQWNYFRYPDPVDRPSSLFDQLGWLRSAGFAVADCFWMQAGHAIYGGYRQALSPSDGILPAEDRFAQALDCANLALQAVAVR